jgi:sulfoxide reductase heme-binding subunit YedZ
MFGKAGLERSVLRHVLVAALGAAVLTAFWISRRDWSPEHRFWRATGDASLVLLMLSLAIGPLARLRPSLARWNPWRREIGIWAAVWAAVHTVTILDGWLRWDWLRLLGYEFVQELGRRARLEPGFGLANAVGALALVIVVVLAVTSSDLALRRIGGSGWRWLHQAAHTVLFLSVLHTAYFLFMHYTQSFHREPSPENWFRWPFVVSVLMLWGLQGVVFAREVRARGGARSAGEPL